MRYTAVAQSTGEGRNGHVRSSDGLLDLDLATPSEMGGPGGATNPEQLFAAGWSNCYLSAIKIAAAKRKVPLTEGVAIDAEVDLGIVEGNYTLAARLNVSLPGVDRETGQALIEAAHLMCPYSRGTRGNIDVVTNLV